METIKLTKRGEQDVVILPTYIYEICPKCHPHSYEKTLAKFIGQVEEIETIDGNSERDFSNEYLYTCCTCGSMFWVGENWALEHAAGVEEAVGLKNRKG